jgi:hypothetical protein
MCPMWMNWSLIPSTHRDRSIRTYLVIADRLAGSASRWRRLVATGLWCVTACRRPGFPERPGPGRVPWPPEATPLLGLGEPWPPEAWSVWLRIRWLRSDVVAVAGRGPGRESGGRAGARVAHWLAEPASCFCGRALRRVGAVSEAARRRRPGQSVHTRHSRGAGLAGGLPQRHLPLHPGRVQLDVPEFWFGIITRQAIRRGTFVSVNHLIQRIRAYVQHWNANAEPFVWTATAEDILAKVRLVQTNVRKLVQNNSK